MARTVVGIASLIVLGVLLYGSTQPPDGDRESDGNAEPHPIEITSTDSGYDTAQKFVRLYCRNLSVLGDEVAKRIAESEDDSFTIAKAWSEAAADARKSASIGVDKRVALLLNDEELTREEKAEWVRDFGRGYGDFGK